MPTGTIIPIDFPRMSKEKARETFERLDSKRDGRIRLRELLSPTANPSSVHGAIPGDVNADKAVSRAEYEKLIAKMPTSPARAKPTPTVRAGFVYRIKREATIRTHARGLVLGRLLPGNTFVATHRKGVWFYGYVKEHPTRKGWVLSSSLPKSRWSASAGEMQKGGPPRDFREEAKLVYRTAADRKVLEFFQQNLSAPAGALNGYATRVPPRDPTRPIRVYANYPAVAANILKRNGKPVRIPAGRAVAFRYTPDGKHAVVYIGRAHNARKVWAIVKMSDLAIPPGTIGAKKPARPITR